LLANKKPAAFYNIILQFLLILAPLFVFLTPAWAMNGALDPTFNPGNGIKNIPVIRRILAYGDATNRTLAYGYFTSMNGQSCNSIARFNRRRYL
jgi:hypothetical protein